MSLATLPTEIIVEVARDLQNPRDLNALVRTCRRFERIFRTQLYDLGLRYTPMTQIYDSGFQHESTAEGHWDEAESQGEEVDTADEDYDDSGYTRPPKAFCNLYFTEAVVSSAANWESKFIQDYLLNHVDAVFRCPSPPGILTEFLYLNLLSTMVLAQNLKMVQVILARKEDRYIYIDHDVPFNPPESNGTPLGLALALGFEEIAHVLLDADAHISACSRLGIYSTPALCMARSATMAMRLVKATQSVGGNIADQDELHRGPLHYAVRYGAVDLVVYFLAIGIDPWECESEIHLPISQAMKAGYRAITNLLLNKMLSHDGIPLEQRMRRLLHVSVLYLNLECVETLMDAGADIFSSDMGKTTAFERLDRNFSILADVDASMLLRIAERLIKEEPYMWPVGHVYRGLWEIARNGKLSLGLVKFLCELVRVEAPGTVIESEAGIIHSGNRNYSSLLFALCPAAQPDKDDESHITAERMIALLLDYGADPTERDLEGRVPLFYAVQLKGLDRVLKLFQDRIGVDRMKSVVTESGGTLLHLAASAFNEPNIRLFIDAGFSVSATDQIGDTPLHKVARSPCPDALDAAKLLLDQGSPIHATNTAGKTALSCVLPIRGDWSRRMAWRLLDAGGDMNNLDVENLAKLHRLN